MRFRSWARRRRLGIQYYPPTSVCFSLPSFSITLARDLQILKNCANIWGSVAEPEAGGSLSSTIHPPQSTCLPSFNINLGTDLQILKNGANKWGSVAEPGAGGSLSSTIHPPQSTSLPSFSIKLVTDLQILKNGANIWGPVAEPGAVGWVVAARLLVLLGRPPFTLNTVQCFQLRLNLHLKQQVNTHIFMCSTQN